MYLKNHRKALHLIKYWPVISRFGPTDNLLEPEITASAADSDTQAKGKVGCRTRGDTHPADF